MRKLKQRTGSGGQVTEEGSGDGGRRMAAWTEVGVDSWSRKLGTGVLGEGRSPPCRGCTC